MGSNSKIDLFTMPAKFFPKSFQPTKTTLNTRKTFYMHENQPKKKFPQKNFSYICELMGQEFMIGDTVLVKGEYYAIFFVQYRYLGEDIYSGYTRIWYRGRQSVLNHVRYHKSYCVLTRLVLVEKMNSPSRYKIDC
jgi:hypothetical protein